jgi:putative ABC transport system permease protein
MKFISQFLSILRVNLTGEPERLGSVLTIVIGVTCAVGVLVAMLSMGTGARRQEFGDVRDDRVVLNTTGMHRGMNHITREQAAAVLGLPGLARGRDDKPIVSFESSEWIEGRRRGTGHRIYFPLIGITANVLELRPEIHFTGGRMFQAGLHELIVSNSCARQFDGFAIGDARPLRGNDWRIVGQFDQGYAQQCVVYGDVESILSAFGSTIYTGITLRLSSAREFGAFSAALKAAPSLKLEARSEREAVEDDFKRLNALLRFVSLFVGTIMAIGATLGAVNSLYSIVDSRKREIATLRAIGFGAAPIVASVLTESMLLAIPGALLGAALAWLFFNNLAASPFGYSFQLEVTRGLAWVGVSWALAMGFIGGLLPALRAARVPVTTALRGT